MQGGTPQPCQNKEGLQLEVDSSLTNMMGVGSMKKISNFHLLQKFCFAYSKSSATFGGGGRGGYNKISLYMIYFSLNRITDFSIGVHYKSRSLYHHSVYSLSVSVIIFTVSFVITKYNS